MLVILIVTPLAIAALMALFPSNRLRITALNLTALGHLSLVVYLWKQPSQGDLQGFLSLDVLGLLVLSVVSFLFAVVSFYLIGYLQPEGGRSNYVFIVCLLIFLCPFLDLHLLPCEAPFWC